MHRNDEELADWAKRLANLAVNLKAVYIYFNNDAEAFAVRNAITIGDYLQQGKHMVKSEISFRENSKSEALNTKQYQNPKSKTFGH